MIRCRKLCVRGLCLNTSVLPETLHRHRILELSFTGTEIKAGMKLGHPCNGSKIGGHRAQDAVEERIKSQCIKVHTTAGCGENRPRSC